MQVDFSPSGPYGLWTTVYIPGVRFTVGPYSHHAIGGPEQATIRAEAGPENLLDLAELAGCHVRIYNDAGDLVWWGIVAQITIPYYALTINVDIEKMFNRVAVAYTTVASGESTTGERATTAWVEDTDSITLFGKRELLHTIGGTTAANAAQKRDKKLLNVKYPQAKPQKRREGNESLEATLTCCGYWKTMEWLYCNVPAQLAFAYEKIGVTEYYLGRDYNDDTLNTSALAQVFDTGPAAWNALEFEVYVKKVGNPPEDLEVAICENPDDLEPGSDLVSASTAPVNVSTSYGWVRLTASGAYSLTANATYFYKVSTAGMNADNYYVLMLDGTQGYPGGALRREAWDGGAWSTLIADMPMRLYTNNIIENSQQIRNILTMHGQFFTRVHVDDASGISSESYRNGDSDALTETIALMETGTTDDDRLLAEVDRNRAVRVYAMPDTSIYLTVDKQGRFYEGQARVDDSLCPVAQWVRTADAISPSVDTLRLSGLDIFFLERSEYDPATKTLNWDALGEDDLFDMLGGE
jgi:hypothetical protein